MIYLVSGPPGNGKSFYAIRTATKWLEEGKVVAGNVELSEDWPRRVAKRNWVFWLRPFRRRRFLREGMHRYHYTEDLEELAALRLHGSGEARGLMVLDEAHNWMNARSWSAEDRKAIVRFFSQHRKLGWDVLLIAQHPEMIDKQVRNLVEYNVFLRNLKKAKWGGVPIFPFNLFLAVWCWHSADRVIVKREVFPLSWRKNLYDTYVTSHGLKADGSFDETIWLPSPPADRGQLTAPPDARARSGATACPPVSESVPPSQLSDALPSGEQAFESDEPEAWPVEGDFTRPS
jgi:hypothetical protein